MSIDMVNEVFNWVVSNGYEDLNEWAADSDYHRHGDTWRNEDGNEVDIWQCAYYAMEASKEDN